MGVLGYTFDVGIVTVYIEEQGSIQRVMGIGDWQRRVGDFDARMGTEAHFPHQHRCQTGIQALNHLQPERITNRHIRANQDLASPPTKQQNEAIKQHSLPLHRSFLLPTYTISFPTLYPSPQ